MPIHPRRSLLRSLAAGAALAATRCSSRPWHNQDVSGLLPPLAFRMTSTASTGYVTQATFRGRSVMLAFGYTHCPDLCPLTLSHLAQIVDRLGPSPAAPHALFVTVDPTRDTIPRLRAILSAVSPRLIGLRGTRDELAALTRRYRAACTPEPPRFIHSTLVYIFDAQGRARLAVTNFAGAGADIDGTIADLRRLAA